MTKIPFENSEILQQAKVTIDGVDYPVTPAQMKAVQHYLSTEELNEMQSNIEESCVAVSPTQPETNEKVWLDNANKVMKVKNDNGVFEEFYKQEEKKRIYNIKYTRT